MVAPPTGKGFVWLIVTFTIPVVRFVVNNGMRCVIAFAKAVGCFASAPKTPPGVIANTIFAKRCTFAVGLA